MRRLSSVGIMRRPFRLVGGILLLAAAAVAVAGVTTLQGADLLLSLLLSAALLMGVVALRRARVTIDVSPTELVIAFRPFLSRRLPLSQVVSVTASPPTSLVQGFGYRILGRNRRGLLVGGPTVTVHTVERAWIVSTDSPADVTDVLGRQLSGPAHT